jgi:Tfp pilus assembly protein PilO
MEALDLSVLVYAILLLFVIVFAAYLVKWVLQINLLVEQQKEQICLLKQIRDQEAAMFNNYRKNIVDSQ